MEFLENRIQTICEELKRLAVVQHVSMADWQYKKGLFLRPAQADGDAAPYEAFDGNTMHWYGPDAHYWFTRQLTVPQSFAGRPVWLHVRTQIDERDDAQNPQFLLFLDGEVAQGMDMNHRDILLAREAQPGKTYRIDLQAYTGTLHTEFRLFAELRETDPEILGLYYDLSVPLEAFPRLAPDGKPKRDLTRALNDAVNLLDLRTPYSAEFAASVRAARALLQKTVYGELAGQNEVIASCIGHTHIDVGWLWTVAQTREKAARSFSTVLRLMDEYPNYRFMSSQPQLYEFVKERYPELYARIRQRVAENRWEPEGGMWVEADCNLTSGESLTRQFLYGKKFFAQEFGRDSRILWLPDVFGYSGALPQIMKKCGVDFFMTTKLAWNETNQFPYDTFRWRGIDGSEVLTHLVTTLDVGQSEKNFFTTYNGHLHPDAILGGWHRYQNKDINNDILITYGYGDGGGGPSRAMLETSARMEKGVEGIPKVRQVFAGTYFDELSARVKENPRLPVWEGELYFEFHRGTYTSMARNKRANRKAEFRMMDLELLSVMAEPLGMAYPASELESMWKTILINQFHDILPGSAIREVYEQSQKEYLALDARTQAMAQERKTALAGPGEGVTVFNTTGFLRSDVVELGDCPAEALRGADGAQYPVQHTADGAVAFLPALPPKGYVTLGAVRDAPAVQNPFVCGKNALETPFYTAEFTPDGRFGRLYDKKENREVFKAGQCGNLLRMYEDKPAQYDNWNIDCYYTEKYWDVEKPRKMCWTESGPVRATLHLEWKISNSTIAQDVHFYADSPRIDFVTTVDWHDHQHLLKALFPVAVHTDEATFDVQFGNLTRKVNTNTSWERARFETCGQKWVDLSEGHYGVSLLNDCKYGHSVQEGCIGLTLLKSGTSPNPAADQETHHFTYALLPHAGDWRTGGTVRQSYFLNQPAQTLSGGKPGTSVSLLSVDAPNAVVETVKRAENGKGTVVRLYESDNALTTVTLQWRRPFAAVQECNLLEHPIAALSAQGNSVTFSLKPYEIKTIFFADETNFLAPDPAQ